MGMSMSKGSKQRPTNKAAFDAKDNIDETCVVVEDTIDIDYCEY